MRILVTGGAGFLGRHLAAALAVRGDAVTVLDDLSCQNSAFEVPELDHPGIRCVRGSTLDRALTGGLVREHDAVLHLASVVGVEETIVRPTETMRNLEGTLHVVDALRASQIALFTSSADVYGLHSRLYDRPMREDDLQVFESSDVNRWIYPKIKALEENAVLRGPGRGVVVRVFNCFGPDMDHPHGKRVVPQFVECILARRPLRTSGTGRQRRAFCDSRDTIRGILLAFDRLRDDPTAEPFVVNLGSEETWTILDLAGTLQEIAIEMGLLDAPLPVEPDPHFYSQPFDDTWDRTPDLTRARQLLGYEPRIPVRDGLRRMLLHAAAARGIAAPGAPRAAARTALQEVDVLILGAGAAGLACRAALAGHRDTVLLEAEDEIGGLLRVHRSGDFVFDTTVHVIQFEEARLRHFFADRLPAGFHAFDRRCLVWQAAREIDYPYQFHLQQLPAAVREDCLRTLPRGDGPDLPDDCTFEAWLLAHFGDGLYRHFFEPYNSKLYGVHPSQLEAAPLVWTIPVDHRVAILAGAEAGRDAVGPAAPCFYPRGARGVAALIDVLAERSADPVRCGEPAVALDPEARVVETARGARLHYRELVSSLPLPALVGMCSAASPELRAAAATLDAAPVTVVEVGVRERRPALDAHWTYFPDRDIPFYRMSRLERIAPDLCPEGASALLLECPGAVPPPQHQVLAALVRLGVIDSHDVDWYSTRSIRHAYVRFRPGWARAAGAARDALESWGIHSVGRYGEWRYANVEQCIVSGAQAVRLPGDAGPWLERLVGTAVGA